MQVGLLLRVMCGEEMINMKAEDAHAPGYFLTSCKQQEAHQQYSGRAHGPLANTENRSGDQSYDRQPLDNAILLNIPIEKRLIGIEKDEP